MLKFLCEILIINLGYLLCSQDRMIVIYKDLRNKPPYFIFCLHYLLVLPVLFTTYMHTRISLAIFTYLLQYVRNIHTNIYVSHAVDILLLFVL